MPVRPEIFISATTKDLGSCRQLIRDALVTLRCLPVVQDHFAPDARTVREMLYAKIADCDAVIHLAGECYGAESRNRDPGKPRRSYTQMEYDLACELKKPVYKFICATGFPYDAHVPESDDLRALQGAHRAALAAGDTIHLRVEDQSELSSRIRELQTRVDVLASELQKTRGWLGRGIAAALVTLLLLSGLIYGLKRDGEASRVRAEEVAKQAKADNEQLRAQNAAQLQQLGKLTELVVQNIRPNAAAGTDPAAAARADTARQKGISLEKLEKMLADEKTDLHVLYAQVESGSAAAEAEAAEWNKLKRQALTKLGDAEKAAGHYAAEIEPYQQVLALIDQTQEPLVWCDAAQNLEYALWRMGRNGEAEPLAREVVDKCTALQGNQHPETLRSINSLANVLAGKGDYAGAEALYRRCLEARKRTLGPEHPDTLRSVNNLANVLDAKGDYGGAEELQRRCLEARERTLGEEHPDTLQSANNLAGVLYTEDSYAGAEALYRRCLEAQERTLGKEHPDTLTSVLGLANVLDDKGDYVGAEALYRRCLQARERTLGKEHPDTAMTAFNLSLLEQRRGKVREALPLAEQAVAAARASLPENHPDRLKYENLLADLRAQIAAASPAPPAASVPPR